MMVLTFHSFCGYYFVVVVVLPAVVSCFSGISGPLFYRASRRRLVGGTSSTTALGPVRDNDPETTAMSSTTTSSSSRPKRVVIVGSGWGGLSTAHALSGFNDSHLRKDTVLGGGSGGGGGGGDKDEGDFRVTVVESAPRVGGLVRDGYTTVSGNRSAEAGQHGFWNNYHNIFRLLSAEIPGLNVDDVLTGYAEQGQYSPQGLEAIWPVYQKAAPTLPTGLAQAAYTRFLRLPWQDRITAFPLVLAFSEFDGTDAGAWERYDQISFRDLCIKLGVSRRCYNEAFEPMILTGLFAPGDQCSAAAALGMAYFFVLQSQAAFDVRWCRGDIGKKIFDPWVDHLEKDRGVVFQTNTRVTGFEERDGALTRVRCKRADNGEETVIDADVVVLAVGGTALNAFARSCPELSKHAEFRRFANLRGTSVLATRIFLDRAIDVPYSANACWGFDRGVGMTVFDIKKIHGLKSSSTDDDVGSIIEVDYYHASSLLVMSDEEIIQKVKRDLDTMFRDSAKTANVIDAAIVRLPQAVNWYCPGSYADMPDAKSASIRNLYFVGDIVRSRHGSWSQEKAYVTGIEAANLISDRPVSAGIIPVGDDEPHVALGRQLVRAAKGAILNLGAQDPSLVDFLW